MSKDILHPIFARHDALTQHYLEDLPEIGDLAPQDQAMDGFRRNFPLVIRNVDVSKDGRTMTYRLRGTKLMENYISMARTVIILQRLPLEVKRDQFAIGSVVFEDNMVITYTGK